METTPPLRRSQAQAYRGSEVLSASPGRLLIITYDGLLTAMTRLRIAFSSHNDELASTSLESSRGFLAELIVTLNREQGGDIATRLGMLYTFVLGELNELAITHDTVRLERNIGLIREIRDAFAQAVAAQARAAS